MKRKKTKKTNESGLPPLPDKSQIGDQTISQLASDFNLNKSKSLANISDITGISIMQKEEPSKLVIRKRKTTKKILEASSEI